MTPTQHSMVRSPHNSGLRIIPGKFEVGNPSVNRPCRTFSHRFERLVHIIT
jgi:hypothetical protein